MKLQAVVTVPVELTVRYEDILDETLKWTDGKTQKLLTEIAVRALRGLPTTGRIPVDGYVEGTTWDAEVQFNIGVDKPEVEIVEPDF